MRLPFLPFLILWFVSGSAQLCGTSREFAVDNCTACPTLDHTRGDIKIAVCEERALTLTRGTEGGIAYECVCLDFPDSAALVYYPHVEGNVTRCANSWETAPQLFTALAIACACTQLYAAAHLMYIVVLSGICSCKQHKCTKINASALLMCIVLLCWLSLFLLGIAAQGKGDIEILGKIWLGYHLVYTIAIVTFDTGLVLLYTSVCDIVFGGENVAGWRHCINVTFWTLIGACALMAIFAVAELDPSWVGADPSWISSANVIGTVLRIVTGLFSSVFMAIAHRNMHVVSLHLTLSRSHGMHVRQFAYAHAYTMHMHTMVTGGAQAFGTSNETDADVYHQNGPALWRYLSLLLPVSGKQNTQKIKQRREKSLIGFGIVLGCDEGENESQD